MIRESRGHEGGASGVNSFDRLHQGSPQLFKHIPLRCRTVIASAFVQRIAATLLAFTVPNRGAPARIASTM